MRCLYHGWLIAADGTVLETPPEPEELGFREKVRAAAYPVREAGGIVWAYLGPRGTEPPLTEFEFTTLPPRPRPDPQGAGRVQLRPGHRGRDRLRRTRNYLHSDSIRPAEERKTSVYTEGHERRSAVERRQAADRAEEHRLRFPVRSDPHADGRSRDAEVRARHAVDRAVLRNVPGAKEGWGNMQAMVPVDDTHTMFYYFKYRYDSPISAEERLAHAKWSGVPKMGVDVIDADFPPPADARQQLDAGSRAHATRRDVDGDRRRQHGGYRGRGEHGPDLRSHEGAPRNE